MLRLSTVIFLAIATIAMAVGADDPVAGEAKKLQGEWQAVESHASGEKRDKDDQNVRQLRFVIKGDELTIPNPNGNGEGRRKTYKLDPAKSPKEIDLTHQDGREKDKTTAAIYKLEGDRLTICMPYFANDLSARPNEFKTTADDGRMLVILERVKPR